MANVIVTGVRATGTSTARAGGDGLLTAFLGPITSNTGFLGSAATAAASGQAGLTGVFTGWYGPQAGAPFVVGVRASATATAQSGSVATSTNTAAHVAIAGVQAASFAVGGAGTTRGGLSGVSQLVVEIDFTGNPTAPYYDQTSQSTGVAAYWRMDDAATLTDAVGSSSGLVTGTPTLITGALAYDTDQALRFNGTSQYAQVTTELVPTGSYSISGWLRFTSLPSAQKVILTRGSYRLEITANNYLSFAVTQDAAGTLVNTTATASTALAANTWYHITAVHDAVSDELRLYLNGVLAQTATHSAGTEISPAALTMAGVPAATAPSYHSSTTAHDSGAGATLFVIPVPTYSQNDLMLAHISHHNGTTVTPPAGWLLLADTPLSVGFQRLYYKIAGATEPASYTWTCNQNTNWAGAISTWTGVNQTIPFAKPVYTYSDATALTHSSRQHFVDAYNTLALALVSGQNTGPTNVTFNSGTRRYYDGTVGFNQVALASQTPVYGTTLEVTATWNATSITGVGMIFLNGTGAGSFTAVDLDEWAYFTVALDDDQVAYQYEARLSGVGSWTDVSTDVRSVNVRYGRQYELNRMESGSGGVTLKNQHRRYDPANTSSIYYPNVKPNRKIRVRALLRGTYYPLFQALIERWPSDWGISWNYDEVSLTLADGFKALNRAGVSQETPAGLSGAQIETMLDRALWPDSQRNIDTGLFIMAANTETTVSSALGVIQDIADSELGIFFIDHAADGSPATFHDRAHRWSQTASLTSQATFTDQPGQGILYHDLVPDDGDDNMTNEWIVTSASGTEGHAVDVISRQQNFPVTGTRSTRLDNPSAAVLQATALLQQTSRPGLRFSSLKVRLTTETATTTWQTVLGLAVSDRVTVVRNPVPSAGGSTITRICFIEGVSWDITPNYWDVSFQLSPIATVDFNTAVLFDGPVSYWRMDEAT